MSKPQIKEAIEALRDALLVDDLPDSQRIERDATGRVVAANHSYKLGYMRSAVEKALVSLGSQP